MDGTIIQQGNFTSTGANKTLEIRSDVDWMRVYNLTQAAAANANAGVEFYWQRGFATNNGMVYFHAAGSQVISISTAAAGIGAGAIGGFTLVDSSTQSTGAATALTAISTAATPRVTVASTALLTTGDVVRLNTIAGAPQLGGIDFTITVIDATHFDLANMAQLTVAGTTGFYRKLNFPSLYYPRRRFITKITQATSAVVTTSVDHGYTVGQEIRFNVPSVYAMTQMDGLSGTVTAVTAGTFTVDIDSSAFTAFAFPLAAIVPFSPAESIPFGEDTAQALSSAVDILGDATINQGYIGMVLGGGAASPGGANADVMYWVAGKSFNV